MWEEEPTDKKQELIMCHSQLPQLHESLITKFVDHPTIESQEPTAGPPSCQESAWLRSTNQVVLSSHFMNNKKFA